VTHERLPRVLFAIGGMHRGGSEAQLFELISRTHGRSLEAILMTFSAATVPEREQRLEELGVQLVQAPPLYKPSRGSPLLTLPLVAAHVRRLRPDVVYSWLELPGVLLAPAARAFGIPMIVARRNVVGARSERFAPVRYGIRRIERSATLVTANSEAAMRTAATRGVPPERLRRVRNGHEVSEPLPMPQAPPVVVGCVANFRPEKAHGRLLAALEDVDAGVPWRVDLAGDGPARNRFAAEIARRGLEGRVRIVGSVTDIREFWRTRHLAVLTSDGEGSPNALIEAALCGRPMVATDGGGTREVVGPSGGVLVTPEDRNGLAKAIARLIEDGDLRARLGEGAFEHAAREFSIERSIESHLTVIAEALGGRRKLPAA
jgi:glycosyltransferase involved in cell wall biosynthesis